MEANQNHLLGYLGTAMAIVGLGMCLLCAYIFVYRSTNMLLHLITLPLLIKYHVLCKKSWASFHIL